jgi:hypothetical protein
LVKIVKIYKILLHKSTKKIFSGPSGLKGSIFGPVGLCPIFRPFGLGLGALFNKKPKPDLRARAQAQPTSNDNLPNVSANQGFPARTSGSNPTAVSYNAMNSLVRFENECNFFYFEKPL